MSLSTMFWLYVPFSYFMMLLVIANLGPFPEQSKKGMKTLFVLSPIGFPIMMCLLVIALLCAAWESIDNGLGSRFWP